MKNFLNAIYVFFQEMGKAKAASALAREGLYKEAQAMMSVK
jgi:hypothetical protein